MDKAGHALIGALAALGVYGLCKHLKEEKPTLLGILGSLLAGSMIGLAPDVLEPATNPNHRSLFHSITFLIALGLGNLKIWQSKQIDEGQKLSISIISAAYGSHLLSDATTKKGLPLLL